MQAMADAEADPTLVYAFRKTGVYVCAENEASLTNEARRAFTAAVNQYYESLEGPKQ